MIGPHKRYIPEGGFSAILYKRLLDVVALRSVSKSAKTTHLTCTSRARRGFNRRCGTALRVSSVSYACCVSKPFAQLFMIRLVSKSVRFYPSCQVYAPALPSFSLSRVARLGSIVCCDSTRVAAFSCVARLRDELVIVIHVQPICVLLHATVLMRKGWVQGRGSPRPCWFEAQKRRLAGLELKKDGSKITNPIMSEWRRIRGSPPCSPLPHQDKVFPRPSSLRATPDSP